MASITYIEFNGTAHQIEVEDGLTVMEGAVNNNVPGIDADCGGSCACATCHVFVDEAWVGKLAPQDEQEKQMLGFAASVQPNSRLACQIKVGPELDGLMVRMPEAQH